MAVTNPSPRKTKKKVYKYRSMKAPKSLKQAITDKANRLYDSVGPDKMRKQMKTDFQNYKRKTGVEHDADPLHPMNAELTGPSTINRKKGGKVGCGNNRLY